MVLALITFLRSHFYVATWILLGVQNRLSKKRKTEICTLLKWLSSCREHESRFDMKICNEFFKTSIPSHPSWLDWVCGRKRGKRIKWFSQTSSCNLSISGEIFGMIIEMRLLEKFCSSLLLWMENFLSSFLFLFARQKILAHYWD